VNDLLLVSDALITDYSSVVFEYSLLRKKTIFFAPDLEEYTASRDFYVDYQEFVPGPIVRDMDSLVTEIERVNEFNPQSLDNFLAYYFDDLDGKASKRFVDALENNFVDFR
ncbi:CDP-glycerol glycerophosphotransferase family protein, partial [Lactobacillaceae bacterium KNUT 0156]|nr:CDP-glycerol glycerophosphotransferase family protein [Weissella cibaria]